MTNKKGILIADSGSTKTAWIYTDNIRQEYFLTGGANPFFRSTGDMIEEWGSGILKNLPGEVSSIYFYAAGVVNKDKGNIIKEALQFFFPAATIEVESDLLAAARATLGKKSGIACILGTGSNSCKYDGATINAHVPPLGYILGDEGSGAVLGRQLIGDYLKKVMPSNLRTLFAKAYPLEYAEILNHVYREEKPNKFLAQFTPFLKSNIEHSYCKNLIENAFALFIERNVSQYEGFENQAISFAGSVAFYFQEQLKSVIAAKNLRLGTIVKEPLEGLVNYHTQ